MIEQLDTTGAELEFESQPLATADPETRRKIIEMIRKVRRDGWSAVVEYSRKFDDVEPTGTPVPSGQLEDCWEDLGEQASSALELARDRIEQYQAALLPDSVLFTEQTNSVTGELIRPFERVGCYIPGGRVPLPSTVLMTAYIAEVAGVEDIVLCSPPRENGEPHPVIQAAASLVENVRLFGVGGVQAIGAMSSGAGEIPAVDMIAGPGNMWVTLAKKEVYGEVEIDMLAGPSEIAIVADRETARSRYVAADLLSQAEHDPQSRVYLFTPDQELIEAVETDIRELVDGHPREEVIRESLDNSALVKTRGTEESVDLVNRLAPEHLELQVEKPLSLLEECKNAGAVFCGNWTPEAIGDYVAGPSHTLPTGGSARFFSPLSVHSFLRHQSVVALNREGYEEVCEETETLADLESLPAHRYSSAVRREQDETAD